MTGQYQDHRSTSEGQNHILNEVPIDIIFESKNIAMSEMAAIQKELTFMDLMAFLTSILFSDKTNDACSFVIVLLNWFTNI